MQRFLRSSLFLLAACLLLGSVYPFGAHTVKMNLEDLCDRSHLIFRGTVVGSEDGTIELGGAEFRIVTYQIRVAEDFKGAFSTKDGQKIAEIRMLAPDKGAQFGALQRMPFDLDLPRLTVGSEYLLFTSQPSRVGLSTTVGLGQGCFSLSQHEKVLVATNELGNRGLFDGMGISTPQTLSYQQLAQLIRDHVR